MTRTIPLNQGKAALVDGADYESLAIHKWFLCAGYARRNEMNDWKLTRIYMHRAILGLVAGDPRRVDHINGDRLDNRRANLRVCTHQENIWNSRISRNNECGFKGVHLIKETGRYRASITVAGKSIHLGCAATKKAAHALYMDAANKFYGEFARSA